VKTASVKNTQVFFSKQGDHPIVCVLMPWYQTGEYIS